MENHGLPAKSRCQVTLSYTRSEGAAAMERLLASQPDTSAVVAANDLLALGIYDVLRKHGLRCPEDLSIVGHNDMPLVDMIDPPLTTVRISHWEMGRQAAEILQEAIEAPDRPTKKVVLRPHIVIRHSTMKISQTTKN
jgi:LacI family transcriptional regulator